MGIGVRATYAHINLWENPRKPNNAMPFIPVTDVVQCELIYLWAGQVCETVLHYEKPSAVVPADLPLLGAQLVSWYNTNLKPLHHQTIQLTQVKLTDLTTDFAPVLNYTTGLPLVGAVGADGLPNNVALVITKRTALRGRSYRGRIYHPGLAESQCAGNQIVGATVTSLVSAYTLLKTMVTGAVTWNLVVVSRMHNGVVSSPGESIAVTTLDTDGFVDSQRRRLPGRGA